MKSTETIVSFTKNAGLPAVGKRRIMRVLKINEISGVDVPAQQGATAPIMKRHDAAPDNSEQNQVVKRAALSTEVDGHVHVLYLDHGLGELNAGETSWSNGHSHPWVRRSDGSIEIGMASGHTHDVATIGKNADQPQGDSPMTPEQIAQLQADLAKANAIAALPAVQKAHYDALAEADRPAFLAKSDSDRDAIVKAVADLAKAESAVVYKAKDGTEYTKKHDPLVVVMAKRLDAQDELIEKANKAASDAQYAKRAGEISNLPGTEASHIAMLKAMDAIPDKAERDAALAALKSQSIELGKAFDESGDSFDTPEAKSAADELETLAKNYIAKNAGATEAQAMDEVLKTRRGAELYAQSTQQ